MLERVVGAARVPGIVTDDVAAAEAFSAEALAQAHEGVMVKALDVHLRRRAARRRRGAR